MITVSTELFPQQPSVSKVADPRQLNLSIKMRLMLKRLC